MVFYICSIFGSDWNYVGHKRVKKSTIKANFLPVFDFLATLVCDRKSFENFEPPIYKTTCVSFTPGKLYGNTLVKINCAIFGNQN